MIADWSELMIEVSQRAKDGSVLNRAKMLTGLAETDLNKMLRVGDMEARATVTTDAEGAATLPVGLRDIRTALIGDKRLAALSLAQIRNGGCGYAIIGGSLVSSEADTAIDIDYYAALPPLAANGTNWLLETDPEIYIFAVLKQAYLAAMNIEGATGASSYLQTLVGARNADDASRRFGNTQMRFVGNAP